MLKNKILRKVLVVSLATVVLGGTGFTSVGQFIGTGGITASADSISNYFKYTVNNKEVTITDYINKSSKELRIPSSINKKNVTKIANYALSDLPRLTSIYIPSSVTYIGDSAFSGCTGLTSIAIPDSVTYMGGSAFSGCTDLTSVTLGNSLTSVNYMAFGNCKGLTSIEIPDSVTVIDENAFWNCTGLTSIAIPNRMTTVGEDAFYGCTDLTIYGRKDSPAETYANNNNINFVEFATLVERFAPTCTEQGKKAYYHNNFDGKDYEDYDCKKVITGDLETWRIIPAKGHSYKEKVTASTCTEQGYTTHTCSVCGDSYTDNYTEPTGHSYKEEVTAPTCTEQGYTTHTCSVCGDSYTDNYIEPTGHSYKEDVTAPTCTEKGYTTHTCSVCGDSYTDSYTEPTGHSYKEDVTAPTTEEEGYTLHTCQKCGDNYKDSYTPKLLANRATLSAENITLGKKITVTANATDGTGEYQYQVVYKQKSQTKWTIVQKYSSNATVTFKPAKATDYDVCVKVKDGDGTEIKKFFELKVNEKLANASSLSAENIVVGQKVTANCLATGGLGDYQYQIVYKQTSQTKWTTAQAFSENAEVTFKPAKATDYDVSIKVKDADGTIVKKFFTVKVNEKLTNTSDISSTEIKKGGTVTVNGSATGGMGNYTYAVFYKQKAQTKWTVKQDFDANDIVSVKPVKATDYDICIKVKDKNGTIAKKYFTVTVTK